ncbi:MAG: CAP domain-containing protein [Methanomicrobiales archaeon]|nr:CAP domain-containing protein [Methanomicrobiales archaeon]
MENGNNNVKAGNAIIFPDWWEYLKMSYYRTKRTLPNGSWQTLRGGSHSRERAIRHAHKVAHATHWEGTLIIFDENGRETYRLYTHARRPWRPKKSSKLGFAILIMVFIIAGIAVIFYLPSVNIDTSSIIPQPTSAPVTTTNPAVLPTATDPATASFLGFSWDTYTSEEKAKEVLTYVNQLRAQNGLSSIRYDSRVYHLAIARVNDMDQYGYMDHVNPVTGTCPDSIKTKYGFSSGEYLAENAYGFPSGGSYSSGMEKEAVDSWMTSKGHRANLLWPQHTAGVVACSKGGHCVFEGLNTDLFGSGCHTAAEGIAYWNTH